MREFTYGIVSTPEHVDEAIRKVRQYGSDFGAQDEPLIHRSEPDPDFVDYHSIWMGVAMGIGVGVVQGFLLLAYMDSPQFNQWGGAFSIPFWSACGWGLYGMIVGSGGLFADLWRRKT